jgi:NTE family protein
MFRRAITKRVLADVEALRADGVRVHLITPGPEDLAVMGVNLMNPAHRVEVLETARETAAAQVRRQFASPLHRRSSHPANDPTGRTA